MVNVMCILPLLRKEHSRNTPSPWASHSPSDKVVEGSMPKWVGIQGVVKTSCRLKQEALAGMGGKSPPRGREE